jgi:hypothetical protein
MTGDRDGKSRVHAEHSHNLDTALLGSMPFINLFASNESIPMVTKRIVEWSGILGATVNVRTLED